MDLQYRDSVAVVTGGTSGIGFATARILLAEGARVVICGRDPGRLERARESLARDADAQHILAVRCDVLQRADVASLHARVAQWGGVCSLLVNNAGQGRVSTFATTDDAAWREELELKFFSQIHTIRQFSPLLAASGRGAIVAVNSLLAYQPESHMVCTSAARAGVQNMLKSLAVEFAPHVRVNSVVVGLIDSAQWQRRFEQRVDTKQTREEWMGELARAKRIPQGRLGQPEEVGRAIAYLGSPVAQYITGTRIEISGGLSRHI